VSSYLPPHMITNELTLPSFFPFARSVTIDSIAAESSGWKINALAYTSEYSWAETDYNSPDVNFNKNSDTQGPVSVAAVGTRPVAGEGETGEVEGTEAPAAEEAKIIVLGTSRLIDNNYFYSESANRDIFLNSTHWLSEDSNLIAISPRDKKIEPLTLTRTEGLLLPFIAIIVIPLSVVLCGVLVIMRKKWKK